MNVEGSEGGRKEREKKEDEREGEGREREMRSVEGQNTTGRGGRQKSYVSTERCESADGRGEEGRVEWLAILCIDCTGIQLDKTL